MASKPFVYSRQKKIIVIRLDALGDLILSVPFMANLKKAYPDTEITAVVRRYTAGVLKGNPSVDRIMIWPEKGGFLEKLKFAIKLRKENADAVISLSPVTKSIMLAAFAGGRNSISYVYTGRPLTNAFAKAVLGKCGEIDVAGTLEKGEKVPHEVLQTFSILEMMGIKDIEEFPAEIFPDKDSLDAAEKETGNDRYIGFHMSPKWLTCGWSEEALAGAIEKCVKDNVGFKAMLTYGGGDEKKIAENVGGILAERRIDFLSKGGLSFSDWAAFVSRCSSFVSTDTGALHCAAALGIPVLGVYEPSTFEHCSAQWAPWKTSCEILKKPEPSEAADIIADKVVLLLDNAR